MNKFKLAVLSASISFLLSSCGGDKESSKSPVSLIRVSDEINVDAGDKPSVSLYFGQDDNNFCLVTIKKSEIKENRLIKSSGPGDDALTGSCSWNGKYYVLSSKHPTYLSLNFGSINKINVDIDVSLKFIDISSLSAFKEFKNIPIDIIDAADIKKFI